MGTFSSKNMKKDYLGCLLRSNNTVFTSKDISLIWNETNVNNLKKKAYRYVKAGKLYSIRRGIYAKDRHYNKFELAIKIYTPAYVSLETVLIKEGIIFQHYKTIFVISYLAREIICDGQKYSFKKIKDSILTNPLGIEKKENYAIASKERAFLDVLYLNKNYYFDNLSSINWEKCFFILPIYENKTMFKKVNNYYKQAKNA